MPADLTVLQTQVRLADPHVVNDDAESLNILQALFEPLVRRTAQGFRPWLAESWTLADDARTWEFRLRPDVEFHDGTVLDAEAVIASIERARAPDLGGVLGTEGLFHSYLGDMAIIPLDARTVRMVTAEPLADLLDLVTDIPIVPAAGHDVLQAPVGSGPWRLVQMTDSTVTMEAHARYWQTRAVPCPVLVWQTEPDAGRRVQRLQHGEADLVTRVPHDLDVRRAAGNGIRLVTAPSHVCTVFMCNMFTGVCADARVRQALNYGFDQQLVIEQLTAGTASPLNGPLTARHYGHEPALAPYPHDPAAARALLAQAGYGQGLALTLDVPSRLPDEAVKLADLLARQYAGIGVETRIVEHTDRPAYAQRVKTKAIHDACCFDSSPLSTFRSLREKFRSDLQGPWWLGYVNGDLNRILQQAQATVDWDRRQALYRSAYRILHAEAPWIYLYNQMDRWGVSDRLAGWCPRINGLISLV